jgi:hypothetical protein
MSSEMRFERSKEEPRNRVQSDATRVETGDQADGESHLPVPVVETRMLAGVGP